MTRDLSATQINMYHRCGVQYEYVYVKGLRQPPRIAMIQGRAFGDTVGQDANHKRVTGEILPQEQVEDTARDKFIWAWNEAQIIGFDEEDPESKKGESLDATIRSSSAYHQLIIPNINPTAVEQRIELTIETPDTTVNVVGYSDIETEDAVIENKLRARKTPITRDILQGTIYVLGRPEKRAHRVEVVPLKKAVSVTNAQYEIDDRIRQTVLNRILTAWKGIYAGHFQPTGDPSVCSWCGFRKMCPYSLTIEGGETE